MYDVADFSVICLKTRELAKGRGSCGLSAAKKKAEEGGGERGEGGGNGWHAVRAVSEQPTGEGVSKSVCPHYPK